MGSRGQKGGGSGTSCDLTEKKGQDTVSPNAARTAVVTSHRAHAGALATGPTDGVVKLSIIPCLSDSGK